MSSKSVLVSLASLILERLMRTLAYPLDDALFGLPGKEHVHVDAVAGVDD